MDYLIQSAGQLTSHLRSLRKARGLSQAQLGAALGVGQTRITRIERDPAAVSVEQFLEVLGVLGVQMVLRPDEDRAAAELPARGPNSAPTRVAPAKRRPSDEPW
jgi:HTH-type transcriptional regulator/antitoxin HipB